MNNSGLMPLSEVKHRCSLGNLVGRAWFGSLALQAADLGVLRTTRSGPFAEHRPAIYIAAASTAA